MRQLKSITDMTGRVIWLWLVMLAMHQVSARPAQAGEPPLPKLKTETQEAFERYVKLTGARNETELKRGTGLLWIDGLTESPSDVRAG